MDLCHLRRDPIRHLNRPPVEVEVVLLFIAANSHRPSAEACILSIFSLLSSSSSSPSSLRRRKLGR